MEDGEKTVDEYCRRMADIFRALGHPLRLKIVRELSDQGRNVNYLHEKLGSSQANISKHLGVLREHSIVTREKQGMENIYELAGASTLELCSCALNCIRERIEDEFQLLEQSDSTEQIFPEEEG